MSRSSQPAISRRLFLWCLGIASVGCKRKPSPDAVLEELPPDLLSSFAIGDPRAAVQLTEGFYPLEEQTWRWTAPEFALVLATPAGSDEHGAELELQFTLPEAVLSQVGPITLQASVGETKLQPQTFATAGENRYREPVSAGALRNNPVQVRFHSDKTMRPGGADDRELAVVATQVGLYPVGSKQ